MAQLTYRPYFDVPESFSSTYRAVMSTKHVRSAADLARFKYPEAMRLLSEMGEKRH